MGYAYTLEGLLAVLRPYAPHKVNELFDIKRKVEHGLLSVGLKIHCLGDGSQFEKLVHELGGKGTVLERNHFKQQHASLCLVLPPVGSARAAILLIECLEHATNSPLFLSDKIQIQVCSPGRLRTLSSSLLAISCYLNSDVLQRYVEADFLTTFSDKPEHLANFSDVYPRGKRLVIYDASGTFDSQFEYWMLGTDGKLIIDPALPLDQTRTDLLNCKSRRNLLNANLVSTLLVHRKYGGYWRELGKQFVIDMQNLLHEHMLDSVLRAPWVCQPQSRPEDDRLFMNALTEVMSAAFNEVERLRKDVSRGNVVRSGLLHDVRRLFNVYETKVYGANPTGGVFR